MSVIGDAVAGLKARLETIADLHVYDTPPTTVAQWPYAEILPPEEIDYVQVAGGGTDIEVVQVVRVEAKAGRESDGWAALYELLDPSAEGSIAEAIKDDTTLDGNVDWCRLEGLVGQVERDPNSPTTYQAGLGVRWYKSGS